MSEVAGVISIGVVLNESDTSVGRLSHGQQAKIVDDCGNRLGPNEDGEICVKSKYQFLGYFGNSKATSNAFDEEHYLKTGDIGHFDLDQKLYLIDRKKDMMKYCASQISPTEIEQLLIKCKSIEAVCVVGIPDDVAGDLPAAVIVPNENEAPISRHEIEQMVAGRGYSCLLDFDKRSFRAMHLHLHVAQYTLHIHMHIDWAIFFIFFILRFFLYLLFRLNNKPRFINNYIYAHRKSEL